MSLPQSTEDDSVKDTAKDTWLHEQIFLVKRTLARNPNYVLAAFVVIVFYLSTLQRDSPGSVAALEVLAKYDSCELPTSPPKQSLELKPKPIFLSQYPDSLDDKLLRHLIEGLTGMPGGNVKSFYSNNKNLKKCVSEISPTVSPRSCSLSWALALKRDKVDRTFLTPSSFFTNLTDLVHDSASDDRRRSGAVRLL
jgi:hypothetical protein